MEARNIIVSIEMADPMHPNAPMAPGDGDWHHRDIVTCCDKYWSQTCDMSQAWRGIFRGIRIHSCHIAKSTFRSNVRQGIPENMSDVERKDDMTNWPKQKNAGMWK